MTDENRLVNEQLVTLAEAAKDFAGVAVPLSTVKRYVYYPASSAYRAIYRIH
jgi:hypothetical protein